MKAATVPARRKGVNSDISIHAAREGGDLVRARNAGVNAISIHAAREGGDTLGGTVGVSAVDFNPRRP